MKLSLLDQMRVWAALTGLILALSYFAALYLGMTVAPVVPMLVTAIGGFELFLYAQDLWLKRKGENG